MKITFDWLKDHLQTNLDHNEIAEILTNLGIEIESIVDNYQKFHDFTVGFIKNAKPHPDADKLKICEVDMGDRILNIVCGAENARAGIFVAVAHVGATLPSNNKSIKQSVIRGVASEGMLCSADELALEDHISSGILELPHESRIGDGIAKALKIDYVIFDISVTPNRADCFSVRGLARDLAAAGAGTLLPLPDLNDYTDATFVNPTTVDIQTPNCLYFSTIAIRGVSEGKTPDYMVRRLSAIGQRLIHFPVDVANYICFDIGQPLHVFDLDKVSGNIIVRESFGTEKLQTLNGNETNLPAGTIVVTSEEKIHSIAGIMGGEASAFSDHSQNILIEGAYFNKVAIARAGQAMRLSTESRTRFERGVDPELIEYAVRYATSLIAGKESHKVSNINRYGTLPVNKNTITLTYAKFHALTNLEQSDFLKAAATIEKLGLVSHKSSSDEVIFESPSWRHDLSIEEDIIEEIVRIKGYNSIKDEELEKKDPICKEYSIDKISDSLAYNNYCEVKTFSFIDEKTALLFAEREKHLVIQTPVTKEFTTMRPSIIASHLKAIKIAQSKSQKNSKIFEVGKRYYRTPFAGDIVEESTLTATIAEHNHRRTWRYQNENVSVFDVKEILEKILNMNIQGFRAIQEAPEYYHPGRSGSYVFQEDLVVAHFGEVHPSILREFDIAGPIACFELFLKHIPELIVFRQKPPFVVSPYQLTTRDFSFVVKNDVSSDDVVNSIKKLKLADVIDISVFDVYKSESIGAKNKAIALEVTMQSDKSTLTEADILEISNKVTESVFKTCGGTLRQ
jgi:phenylalanyl-tRNA synthetase beta chain